MYNFINSTFDQTINVQIASPKLKNEKLAKISQIIEHQNYKLK